MGWNHRILVTEYKHSNGEIETWYSIHEVYYDKNGKPEGPTKNAINSKKELRWTLKQMKIALSKPFLWGDSRFPQEYKK
jgi:hypothetical protein